MQHFLITDLRCLEVHLLLRCLEVHVLLGCLAERLLRRSFDHLWKSTCAIVWVFELVIAWQARVEIEPLGVLQIEKLNFDVCWTDDAAGVVVAVVARTKGVLFESNHCILEINSSRQRVSFALERVVVNEKVSPPLPGQVDQKDVDKREEETSRYLLQLIAKQECNEDVGCWQMQSDESTRCD